MGSRVKRLVGRRCYEHLGGELGIRVLELFVAKGWVELDEGKTSVYILTEEGRAALGSLGLDMDIR